MLVALKHSTENIGDDIQRLGLASILPDNVVWIDRDDHNALMALQPKDKLIVSGWFHKRRHRWYSAIESQCLYIGFYIDKPIQTNTVVGCRDTYTLALYPNSWLSYCTSMLSPFPKAPGSTRNGVVLCDVAEMYRAMIPDVFVRHATTVSHESEKIVAMQLSDRDIEARRLLDIYAGAELVITSRLHVLLPCLAFGTPVVFTNRYEPQRAAGYEDLYWTLNDCPWACDAPSEDTPWIHIPPKVSPEYISGMTQGLRAAVKKFVYCD